MFRQTYKMIKEERGMDPKLMAKQGMISKQTRELNEFYNPEHMYSELSGDGSIKPLDTLVEQEKARLGN